MRVAACQFGRRSSQKGRRSSVRLTLEALEDRLAPTVSTPFTANGQPWEILSQGPSVIEAENFDYGGEGVAYHSSYAINPGGAYRPNEGIGIEGPNASTGGTYDVGYFDAGDWMNYTINVDQAGSYVLDLHAASAPPNGATAHVSFGGGGASTTPGVTSSEITISNTGGWGNYEDFTTTVTLTAGTQVMTVWEDSGGYNLDSISLTPQAQANPTEQAYTPEGTSPGVALRGVPPTLTQFGAVQIEAEDYDLGGQAASATGVQNAGYYWLDQSQDQADYPYTSVPFRPGDDVDTANGGTGIVTTNWQSGDWTQYSVLAATNATPVDPASTQPSYQPTSPTQQYQVLVAYSNAGTQAGTFAISSTWTDPSTGQTEIVQVGTVSLAPTGSVYNYETASTFITLPGMGLNTLRFSDVDPAGTNSSVDLDYFRLINSATSGNNGLPWDIATSGAATYIPASNYDVAPGSYAYPSGTSPVVAPTTDSGGGGNEVQDFTAGDSLTYTIMAEMSSEYNLGLRVANTGSTEAQLQVSFDAGASFGRWERTISRRPRSCSR